MNRVYRVSLNTVSQPSISERVVKRKPPQGYVWCDPDPWLEGWIIEPHNNLEAAAKEVYDSPEPTEIDTGLIDKHGTPIHRIVQRYGIGFHANFDEE